MTDEEAIASLRLFIVANRQGEKRKIVAFSPEQAMGFYPGSFSAVPVRQATKMDLDAMCKTRGLKWPQDWGGDEC